MSDETETELEKLNARLTLMEHALFGIGDRGAGGVLQSLEGLRLEFHEFRQQISGLYRMLVLATFSLVGTILGGVIVFLVSDLGAK